MRYGKELFLLLATVTLAILLLKDYSDAYKDVVHLKKDNEKFKRRPENSVESTVLHREKEIYDHALQSDN